MEWRFAPVRGGMGAKTDGWRLLPFEFRIAGEEPGRGGDVAVNPSAPGFVPPHIVRKGEAEYPEKARNKGLRGTVVYRVTISAEGKMVEADLEQSLHPMLDQSALVALEHTLFLPATQDGQPVQAEILVPFTFGSERR